MHRRPRNWPSLPARLVGGIGICLLPLAGAAHADNDASNNPAPAPAVAPAVAAPLTLAECLQIAAERQPNLAAGRATLASAQDNARGLDRLRVPTFLARDLPVRRKQAHLGVDIAAAGLDQAEHETIYAVTRTYLSVIYAREQRRVTQGVVDHMQATMETARRLVQAGSRDVTTSSVDKVNVYLRLAETRVEEASAGIERAKAALREAMGVGPDFPLEVAAGGLPDPHVSVGRDEVIGLALARRGELVQAGTAATVTCLEIRAQDTSFRPIKPTFASVVDIHSRPVPGGVSDGEYRPGALAPDMPTTLAGPRWARVDRARDLYARAGTVVDKTRNLIALEAEDAFLRWQDYSRRAPKAREAAEKASQLAEDTRRDFGGEQRVKVEDVLTNEVLAAQARASYNEALYYQAVALAALERITAGGFCAGFTAGVPEAPPIQARETRTNETGG